MVKSGKTRGVNRLVLMLELGLVVLLTFLFVRAVIAFTAPESLWTDVPSTVIAADAASQGSSRAFNWSFDPFHRTETVKPVDAGVTAPETSLNLKLTGLRAGEDGSALLQTPDNQQRAYSVGDEIISGVVLHSVSPDYIVLSLNGRLERLTFERKSANRMIATQPSQPVLSALKPIDFVSAIRLDPVKESGQVLGYKISPRNASIDLSAFGFQAGDVITRVGGADLTSGPPNVGALTASLRKASSVDVTLLRNGQAMTLKVGTP